MPPKTNEQVATEMETAIRDAKRKCGDELAAFLQFNAENHPLAERQSCFRDVQRTVVAFYDLCEQSVADSNLLGAHRNEWWVRNKAETSSGALESVLNFHEALTSALASLDLPPSTTQPSPMAYASMQRIVKQNYPKEASDLRARFAAAGLPTRGFDDPLPAASSEPTSIDFENGELKQVSGLSSADAKDVISGRSRVVKGDLSVSGAFGGQQVVDVVEKAVGAHKPPEGMRAAMASEAKKAPVQIFVKIVATLLAAAAAYLLAKYLGCNALHK